MLEKPEIQNETIIACLLEEHGLRITAVDFLPLGGDLDSAVYRAVADNETAYFCKLRRGAFNEFSVILPKYLSEAGIAQILQPLLTKTGRLWAELDEFNLILYLFVEGTSGYEVELSERQWADFGAALQQIHSVTLPPALREKILRENYSSMWRDRFRDIIARLDQETFDDPITLQMAAFLSPRRDTMRELVERAERLAPLAASSSSDFVLCHSDIHPGNLFIGKGGTLYIVDWDEPMLAPKERDLMFIGGGQGFMGVTAGEEETLFYRWYGPTNLDPIALAYYRYERNVYDLMVQCMRILSSTLGDIDRAQELEILKLYFLPDSTVEMAFKSDRTESTSAL